MGLGYSMLYEKKLYCLDATGNAFLINKKKAISFGIREIPFVTGSLGTNENGNENGTSSGLRVRMEILDSVLCARNLFRKL